MIFIDNIVDFLQKNINQIPTSFHLKSFNLNFCANITWNEPETLCSIINEYETYFGKTFNRQTTFPLYNSYIIPSDKYEKIMKWIIQLYDKLYPRCIEKSNATHFGHIGGIYERIMGFAIGQEELRYIELYITHILLNEELKETCY